MKTKIKYLTILLVTLSLGSCVEPGQTREVTLNDKYNTINVMVGQRSMVHKGNCKSEIHKCKCN
jgi:hypothetical protein